MTFCRVRSFDLSVTESLSVSSSSIASELRFDLLVSPAHHPSLFAFAFAVILNFLSQSSPGGYAGRIFDSLYIIYFRMYFGFHTVRPCC